ncbi:MAG: DUF2281 domain-containing protein [Saprospiraceae bacterium]|nr:DUF2281 domain-containing protein [Saprospiraceae bacterium]
MFEVTIRTDNQAALEQLLEFMKGLNLQIVKPSMTKTTKKAKTIKVMAANEVTVPEPSEGNPKSGFGCLKGMIHLAPDWDEPLEDFKEYMY